MTRTIEVRRDSVAMQPPRTREDSLLRAAFLRAENAGALVDSIVAIPASLRLQVGDSLALHQIVQLEARDTAGMAVKGFVPLYMIRPVAAAARLRGGFLVALTEGTATLVITSVRPGPVPTDPLERPVTRVELRVVR
jgi:hypothetical protein